MSFKSRDAVEVARTQFKEPTKLLGDWLVKPSLGMVYGWRGTGKSAFALAVATCLAGGGDFLTWTTQVPVRVAYVDCELGLGEISRRQRKVILGQKYDFDEGQLKYLSFEDTGGIIPNLSDKAMQRKYSEWIADSHVLILDHISGICRPTSTRDDDVSVWARVQEWAIAERGKGKAILFIHHSGKGGAQRGTSTREDCLDYVIALRRPALYEQKQGCRFELHFEKCRHFYGEAAQPLYCELLSDDGSTYRWTGEPLGKRRDTQIFDLSSRGISALDIAKALDISPIIVKTTLDRKGPQIGVTQDEDSDSF